MSTKNADYEANPGLSLIDKKRFENAVENCMATLGKSAFVRSNARSAPLADALMYALEVLSKSDRGKPKIQKAVQEAKERLLKDRVFIETLSQGTNGKAKIEQRLDLARSAIETAVKVASR
jgi:hypothetical protein